MSRAKKRLDKEAPTQTGPLMWKLPGLQSLGDEFTSYTITTDGSGTWYCSCTQDIKSDSPQRICSHIAATALHLRKTIKSVRPFDISKRDGFKWATPEIPYEIKGIPKKFKSWRQDQRETVEWIINQIGDMANITPKDDPDFNVLMTQKVICLEAPTGSGKSVVSIAAAKLLKGKFIYVCSTKQLQMQIAKDFKDAVVIKGRSEYKCMRFTDLTAAECTHKPDNPKLKCPKLQHCPYYIQKSKAARSNMVIANYSYILTEGNYVANSVFKNWPLLIFDEADNAEGELMNFVSLVITDKQLEKCKITPPKFKTKLESWVEWCGPTLISISRYYIGLENSVDGYVQNEVSPPLQLIREAQSYARLISKLKQFQTLVDDTWVAELDSETEWKFKPTWVSKVGYMLTNLSPNIIAMSATILNSWAWGVDLGIKEKIPFKRLDSTFPVENRPVIYLPVADYSYKNMKPDTYRDTLDVIEGLCRAHPGDKGLIHTVSYQLARYITENTKYPERLFTHSSSAMRSFMLERLIKSPDPLVLVSPSYERGIDLKDDLGRWQVIIKIPFLGLGDKQTSKRRWSGNYGEKWYLLSTLRNMLQMAGRIVRGPDDYGTTYILDERFPDFMENKIIKDACPKWFIEAVEW